MAKTESTAVNKLIELQQTATPLKPDPSDDLMFRVPDKKQARMTSTIPALKTELPPLPRQRAPQGTVPASVVMAPTKPSVRMHTATDPVTMPEVQPWARAPLAVDPMAEGSGETDVITDVRNAAVAPARPSLPPPLPPRASLAKAAAPAFPAPTFPAVAPAPTPAYPSAAPYLAQLATTAAPDMTSHQPWFDDDHAPAPIEIDVDLGTDRVRTKTTDWRTLLPKLIAPTLGLCIVGMFVGGFLAFDGQGGGRVASPTPPTPPTSPMKVAAKVELKAAPAPTAETPPNLAPHASAPAVTEAQPPATPVVARPALVDVRLDSTPSGATVTLIDRGKSTFLGTTPISTALDPTRQYEVVFSHASKPTQIERLDPAVTKRLAIVLGATGKAEAPKAVKQVETSKVAKQVATEAPKKVNKVVEKTEKPEKTVEKTVEKTETAKPEKAVVEAPKGEGVLMVSSKPPCEIVVDGVPTGLTTPQRALKLPAGTHRITLINTGEQIKKTMTVTISADQPTKVIENFMK